MEKSSQIKQIICLGFILIVGFLAYQLFYPHPNQLTIVGKTESFTLKTSDNNIFYFKEPSGDFDLQTFFNSQKYDVFLPEVGKSMHLGETSLYRLSEHISLGKFNSIKILFFENQIETDEIIMAQNTSIHFQTDFWVLDKYLPPVDSFPLPKTAILKIGNATLNKNQRTLSKDRQLPIMSTKESGRFLIQCNKNCQLKTD